MNFEKLASRTVAACLVSLAGVGTLRADLPVMQEKEWLGYFLGFEGKKSQFGVTGGGKSAIKVLGKQGSPLSSQLTVYVDVLVEELFPDGKVTARRIAPESLESAHPAATKINQAVIAGKVTGDASFELFVNEDRGAISLGGRLVDPGTVKNPLRFSIRLRFQDAYLYDEPSEDKKKIKAFENKIKNDRMQLVWTDRKRVKQSLSEAVDASSAELNGPGVAALQMEISSYLGARFEVSATGNSSMQLSNADMKPLHRGFNLTWSADPEKDPEAKARLVIDVK